MLHGFMDHAVAAKRRLLGNEPLAGWTVFAPNGLFPAPVHQDDQFIDAYAWYFRDSAWGREMISPELAAKALLTLIGKLNLESVQWTILGFSQGGFFAPHLVEAGLKTTAIVGAGAGYRWPSYEALTLGQTPLSTPIPVYAIHGEKDSVVDYQAAKKEFAVLQEKGFGKKWISLPGVGHTVDEHGRKEIRRLLQEISA